MQKKTSKYLVSIVGPTASGKTALGVHLAKIFNTEVISADSRQVFIGMDIGTAKPEPEELQGIPHHLLDIVEPDQAFSAGKFAEAVESITEQLFQQHDVVLMVGGSGFYLQAVWEGFDDIPEVPPKIREQLTEELEEKGLSALQEELKEADPELYQRIDTQNPRRILRGLEVFRTTGKPLSFYQNKKEPPNRNYQLLKIGLDLDRELLYDRINQRVDQMLEAGLEAEVRRIWEKYGPDSVAMTTVGYQEFIPYLQGETPLEEAIRLVKRNSRRYAKRQYTWFRRYDDIAWFPHQDWAAIENHVKKSL